MKTSRLIFAGIFFFPFCNLSLKVKIILVIPSCHDFYLEADCNVSGAETEKPWVHIWSVTGGKALFFFLVHSDKATAGQNPAYLIVHVFLTMSSDLIIRLKILVTLTGGLVNSFISQTSHRAVASWFKCLYFVACPSLLPNLGAQPQSVSSEF